MAIGVIGGGALGLAAALRLAEAGRQVVVIEREQALGGLASGFRVGPSYLEKFYHHLFATDTTAVELIRRLGLGDRLVWGYPDTSLLRRGRFYSMDSPLDVLRFEPLPPLDRLRMGVVLAYLKLLRDYRRLERWTTAEWLQRWMGFSAYKAIWEPQLSAKFGAKFDQIAMPWFWARVHCRTARLGYVRGGFQLVYERLGEAIVERGGRIELGKEVLSITTHADGTLEVATRERRETFQQVLVTLPTRLFLRLAPGLPSDYVERYQQVGEHFGAHCLILALDRQVMPGVYWLSVLDRDLPFMAAVEHTNFLPADDYGGRHLLYLGNYLPMDHELFRLGLQETLDRYMPHLPRLNPKFRPSWVREAWVWKAPYAQPIVTRGYADRLPPHRTPLPGVFLANMGHVYPQDRGQNYSIALGQRVAELMLSA